MALDPNQVRDALLRTRQDAVERRLGLAGDLESVIAASTDVATDDEHDPEGATIAYERSRVSTLIEQADEQLLDVEAALDRLTDGSYGRCGRCGGEIAEERLQALPATRTCLGCATRIARR